MKELDCFFQKMKCFDVKVQRTLIGRLATSHALLAFFYGTFLFAYEIKFLRELVPILHPFLIVWSVFLILYDLIVRQSLHKIWKFKILVLFVVSAFVTTLITLEIGIVNTAKSYIMAILPLLVFLPLCHEAKNPKKNLLFAMSGGAFICFLGNLTALVMYVVRFSSVVEIFGIKHLVGIRHYVLNDPTSAILLYGFNIDTNHSAIYSIVFMAYSVFLFYFCKEGLFSNKWINTVCKVFAVLNFIVQLCYFPLANSRGGWLSLMIALLFIGFVYFYRRNRNMKVRVLRIAVALVLSTVFTFACAVIPTAIRTGFSSASFMLNSNTVDHESGDGESEELVQDSFVKEDNGTGAGRIIIWKESAELFLKRPVFGVNSSGNAYYAEKFNVASEKLKKGAAVHNSYLDLLLDYGICGFITLLTFFLLCALNVLKKMMSKHSKPDFCYYSVTFFVLVVSLASVFLSCVFINTTAMYFTMLVGISFLCSQDNYIVKKKGEGQFV